MTDGSLKKLLLTGLTLVLVITGATVAFAQLGDDSPSGTTTEATTSTNDATTTTGEDVSGPCDEAEHADDPECAGGGQDRGDDHGGRGRDHPEDDGVVDDDDAGEDISGPCDEAEHANDPECTGAPVTRTDNSGPGSLNSGPGSVSSGHDDSFDDDSSGPGSGDDDGFDDSSGPGSGGDDSSGGDSSGHGSGGDDD